VLDGAGPSIGEARFPPARQRIVSRHWIAARNRTFVAGRAAKLPNVAFAHQAHGRLPTEAV
jgi:hypothetical protein